MSLAPLSTLPSAPFISHHGGATVDGVQLRPGNQHKRVATAIAYWEANSGAVNRRTANRLVPHSVEHGILSVIDSAKAGPDVGTEITLQLNYSELVRAIASLSSSR